MIINSRFGQDIIFPAKADRKSACFAGRLNDEQPGAAGKETAKCPRYIVPEAPEAARAGSK